MGQIAPVTWEMQYFGARDDKDKLKQVILTYFCPKKLKQNRKMKKKSTFWLLQTSLPANTLQKGNNMPRKVFIYPIRGNLAHILHDTFSHVGDEIWDNNLCYSFFKLCVSLYHSKIYDNMYRYENRGVWNSFWKWAK